MRMRQCDVYDVRGHDDDAADPIVTSELLSLASASPGPLCLNKAELQRLGRVRPAEQEPEQGGGQAEAHRDNVCQQRESRQD